MIKIGLLSDTHCYVHPKIYDFFAECNEIWHAGDIGDIATADELNAIKPLKAVYGNIDGHIVRSSYPESLIFNCENVKVYMTHIGGYPDRYAKQVKDIIKLFRQYAAPRIKPGAAGMFFIPPGTFKLKFLYNGKENTNITRVGESVIESIDVNYAPNGWATHTDGAPVQTTLTMTFKETQLVDRTQIEKGY